MKGLGQHTEKQHEAKTAGEYRQAAEEHTQTLKSFWKNFLVSGLFVVAAIVIILACLAWFMNNSRVNATGVGVSAAGARYSIIADGEGESGSHVGYYERSERTEGEKKEIEGLDVSDSMTVTLSSNLNNESAGTLYPGARGQIKFTVKPLSNDLNGVTIKLSRILKTSVESDSEEGKKTNATLAALSEGHLQFFLSCDKSGFYSNLVQEDSFTLNKSMFCKEGSTETTEDVPVTLSWVWPQYMQNFVYVGNANYYKNLFASSNSVDYKNLQDQVNKHKSNFYLGSVDGAPAESVPNLEPGMSSTDLAKCAALYNNADEFLGSNVRYCQLRITSKEVQQ